MSDVHFAAVESLCTDWEGTGVDTERAGASVGALIADAIAEVVPGANALDDKSTTELILINDHVGTGGDFGNSIGDKGSYGRTGAVNVNARALTDVVETLNKLPYFTNASVCARARARARSWFPRPCLRWSSSPMPSPESSPTPTCSLILTSNINSGAAVVEGLCTDWGGTGVDMERAGASVGAIIADAIAEVVAGADALANIYSGAAAEGLCTDWEGTGVDTERASACVRALIANAIAEVAPGANALVDISTTELILTIMSAPATIRR